MIIRFFFSLFLLLSLSLQAGVLPSNLRAEQAYLPGFIKDEQSRNDRVENTDIFASINNQIALDLQYRPEAKATFPLSVYLIPSGEVEVYETKSHAGDIINDAKNGQVRFFVHPASIAAFAPYLSNANLETGWEATSTSSYRSLLAWQNQGNSSTKIFSLKVSLDVEIGEISRMLSRSQIERATAVSFLLQNTSPAELAERGIYFIDEPVSVYLKKYQYGYSIREMPELNKGERLVPLFSFYSRAQGESELQKKIDLSGLSAKDFVRQNLLKPLVEQTFYLAFEHGLIGAPHEQNILVKLKNGKLTNQFYYRDLGSFHINSSLRNLKGRSSDFIPRSFEEKSKPNTKLELIENIQDYLLNAQFYALKRSLRPGQISDSWIEKEVFQMVQEQVYKYTGSRVSSWLSAKAMTTKAAQRGLRLRCESIFQ